MSYSASGQFHMFSEAMLVLQLCDTMMYCTLYNVYIYIYV